MKLKFYLGTRTALAVYVDKCIRKKAIQVPFIKFPFLIRYNDFADDQIFNEVILKQSYTGIEVNKNSVFRILDLGANMGLATVSFLSEYPTAEVAVVEPDADNFKLLMENTKPYNNPVNRVHYFNKAVYSHETDLYIEDLSIGSHGYRMAESASPTQKGKIEAITINWLLDQLGWDRVDIVKVDIEGAEKELFEANTEWLARTRYLIVETHDRFKKDSTKALFRALENKDYKMKIWNRNLLFRF